MKLVDCLRAELGVAGLLPPPERAPYLAALVLQRGQVERSILRSEVGAETWTAGLNLLAAADPESAVVRALGYGAFLTEFLVAPLALGGVQQQKAERLGARANLIVSLYDNLLDQGYAAKDVLPESFGESIVPLVPALVRGYFTQVPDAPARKLLDRAIRRMYEAENLTTAGDSRASVWRRKSALPWVVMGLGGWVFGNAGDWRHIMWMFRLGCFLGWVDDAADLEKDLARGHANRLAKEGCEAARRIARLGRRVLDWWDVRLRPDDSRDAFRYCVSSWIGSRQR